MFLNLLGIVLNLLHENNFVSATMLPEVGKQGNIGSKHISTNFFYNENFAIAPLVPKTV